MRRVATVALILAAGCAGGHGGRQPDETRPLFPGPGESPPVKAHESAGQVAEDVTGGILQGLFDVFSGGGG